MITGAQAVVDCLRREGIDHVFGIPGTQNLPILDVLRATPEIRFLLTLRPALERALDSGLPAVVDVVIDQKTLAPVVYKK